MTDRDSALQLDELAAARRAYWNEYRRQTRNWRPLPAVPLWLSAGGIGGLYLAFHIALLLGGAALTLWSRPAHELGIAIVVGALFGLGAGGAQVYAVAQERQRLLRERTLGESYFDGRLTELGNRVHEMTALLEARGIPAPRSERPGPFELHRRVSTSSEL